MWRAILRVISSACFGLVTFSFSMDLSLIAAADPGVHYVSSPSVKDMAVSTGVAVFLGLLLRDLASGINREN